MPSRLDPRERAKLIVAECCRNLSVVGAEPVAATNNLNFGNPARPEIMAQLVEAIKTLLRAANGRPQSQEGADRLARSQFKSGPGTPPPRQA